MQKMKHATRRTEHGLQHHGISKPKGYLGPTMHQSFGEPSCEDKIKPTILNHCCMAGESSFINDNKSAPMQGKKPQMTLIFLYLPVRCISHLHEGEVSRWYSEKNVRAYPAHSDPKDMEIQFGIR